MRNARVSAIVFGLCFFLSTMGVVRGQQSAVPKQLFPAEDGAALTIFYGGETRGSLDQCGCPRHPMGGLARRLAYVGGYRSLFPETAVMQLGVGNDFNDQGVYSDPPFRDVMALNEHALRGYSKFPYDAANLSYQDLRVVAQYFKTASNKQAVGEFPVLKTLVSANVAPGADKKAVVPFQPYLIREIKAPRAPKGVIRVGITGFSEQLPSEETGFVWRDPMTAAKDVLPALRKQVDVLIVLTYMSQEQSRALAEAHQEIDVMITGHTISMPEPLEKVGKVNYLISNFETKFMGELHLVFDRNGGLTCANRYVGLDETVPDQPDAAKLRDDQKAAVDEARRRAAEGVQ